MGIGKPKQYLIGIFLFSHLAGILASLPLQSTAVAEGSALVNQQAVSGLYVFGLILTATALMLLLYKLNLRKLIRIWFLSAIFITSLIFFLALFPPFLALGSATASFIVRKLVPDMWIRNIADSFSYAGAGALFGTMLGVAPALILLAVLGLYDILSVFWTKHMITLVKDSIDTDSFMGLIYPKSSSQSTEIQNLQLQPGGNEGTQIGILGGGDIIIPMMLSVSLVPVFGIGTAIASSIGSAAGLAFLMQKSEEGKFYPAIPSVGIGSLLGWGVYLLITALF